MLELAPKKALRGILKEYREQKLMLEPLTLKQCANQVHIFFVCRFVCSFIWFFIV